MAYSKKNHEMWASALLHISQYCPTLKRKTEEVMPWRYGVKYENFERATTYFIKKYFLKNVGLSIESYLLPLHSYFPKLDAAFVMQEAYRSLDC